MLHQTLSAGCCFVSHYLPSAVKTLLHGVLVRWVNGAPSSSDCLLCLHHHFLPLKCFIKSCRLHVVLLYPLCAVSEVPLNVNAAAPVLLNPFAGSNMSMLTQLLVMYCFYVPCPVSALV